MAVMLACGCSLDWNTLDPRDRASELSTSASGGSGGGPSASSSSVTTTGGGGGAGGMEATGGHGGAGGGGGTGPLGPWSNPVPVSELNTSFAADDDPSFTADGLELVLNSNRAGVGRCYVALRTSVSQPWGTPTPIPGLGSAEIGDCVIAPDGLTLWTHRNIDAKSDAFVSTRSDRAALWSTPTPVSEINTSGNWEFFECVLPDGLHGLISRTGAGVGFDLFEVSRTGPNAPWTIVPSLGGLNSNLDELAGWLSPDRLEIYLDLHTPFMTDTADIHVATRASITSPWGAPVPVTELNDVNGADSDPFLSLDGRLIMFSRGSGNDRDIYMATR